MNHEGHEEHRGKTEGGTDVAGDPVKYNFADKCVPKCNLGTRVNEGKGASRKGAKAQRKGGRMKAEALGETPKAAGGTPTLPGKKAAETSQTKAAEKNQKKAEAARG